MALGETEGVTGDAGKFKLNFVGAGIIEILGDTDGVGLPFVVLTEGEAILVLGVKVCCLPNTKTAKVST